MAKRIDGKVVEARAAGKVIGREAFFYKPRPQTGTIRKIKRLGNTLKKFYITPLVTERHIKFISYEVLRTGSSMSSIVRTMLDAYIDKKCEEDSKIRRAMEVMGADELGGVVEDVIAGVGTSGLVRRHSEKARMVDVIEDDFEDEYIKSVPGSEGFNVEESKIGEES